jgi:hypothetical protein
MKRFVGAPFEDPAPPSKREQAYHAVPANSAAIGTFRYHIIDLRTGFSADAV